MNWIKLDTPFAKKLGFTSDNFRGYPRHKNGYIYINFIASFHEGKGRFLELLRTIERAGYGIKVPKPSPRMQYILTKYGGFTKTVVPSVPEIGLNYRCELRVKEPRLDPRGDERGAYTRKGVGEGPPFPPGTTPVKSTRGGT